MLFETTETTETRHRSLEQRRPPPALPRHLRPGPPIRPHPIMMLRRRGDHMGPPPCMRRPGMPPMVRPRGRPPCRGPLPIPEHLVKALIMKKAPILPKPLIKPIGSDRPRPAGRPPLPPPPIFGLIKSMLDSVVAGRPPRDLPPMLRELMARGPPPGFLPHPALRRVGGPPPLPGFDGPRPELIFTKVLRKLD